MSAQAISDPMKHKRGSAVKTVKKGAVVDVSAKKPVIFASYSFLVNNIPITVKIYSKPGEFVPIYDIDISTISAHTKVILEKIRNELVKEVNLGIIDIIDLKMKDQVENKFRETIDILVRKYFPDVDDKTAEFLITHLIQKSLGLGNIELLMADKKLEEIAVNSAEEPVWVYHREFGWLKTNVLIENEDQTRHFSTTIGRRVGRQITLLNPLMDAHLATGDRVNATLMPISVRGNTITLRKFASKPWTITDFIKAKTINAEAAALIWQGVQYELSALISGGTATGKTSMLNVVSNFFPPNQRIISIEDTREIQLPSFLHWVPMNTRLPNPEGKGEVSMLDLMVNSLRQRPDRIIVGEVRRQREAEVLFEAIHTGHSVYATIHANDTRETITRLTNPPINVPKSMLPAISMIIVQYRNRRTGIRRTFQVSEILENGDPNILLQLDLQKDILYRANKSKSMLSTLQTFTGMTNATMQKDLVQKAAVLKWLVSQNVNSVNSVGRVIAEYYTNNEELMRYVHAKKSFPRIAQLLEADVSAQENSSTEKTTRKANT